ncbi:MAG: GntR family transcriptional regulator, partial [Trinickia sp.]
GRQAVAEMNLILDAIRCRDARRARDAATAHVARVAVIAAQLLQQGQEQAPSETHPSTAAFGFSL